MSPVRLLLIACSCLNLCLGQGPDEFFADAASDILNGTTADEELTTTPDAPETTGANATILVLETTQSTTQSESTQSTTELTTSLEETTSTEPSTTTTEQSTTDWPSTSVVQTTSTEQTTSTTTPTTSTTSTSTTTTTAPGPCLSLNCSNGGSCGLLEGVGHCFCLTGFSGDYCENTPCNATGSNPCLNGGTCLVSESTYECKCPPEWLPSDCKQRNWCYGVSCLNGGTCVPDPQNEKGDCKCHKEWLGPNCSLPNPCDPNPCLGDGDCWPDDSAQNYTCKCPEGHLGPNCAFVDPCLAANPCDNGGTCSVVEPHVIQTVLSNATFVCRCREGFEGDICSRESEPSGSGSAGTIAAALIAVLLAIALAVTVVYLVRYIRRARKLKGKYNPAKEEMGNANGPPMAMVPMSKEERLI